MANEQIIGIQSLLSKLLVADLTLSVLIDSGAAISVIRKSVFDRIRASFPRLVLEDSDTEAAAINGSNLKFLGVSRLPCRWLSDGPQFHFKFFVTRDLSVPCVVGIDLLQAQKCAVDFHLLQLSFCCTVDFCFIQFSFCCTINYQLLRITFFGTVDYHIL